MNNMETITLANLAEATPQQVFDQVVNHLRNQGKRSEKDGYCRYRGDNGTKCAAGCLIADDEMHYVAEENTWPHAATQYSGIAYLPTNDLIRELQCIHDMYLPEMWEERFKELAEKDNLIYKYEKEN